MITIDAMIEIIVDEGAIDLRIVIDPTPAKISTVGRITTTTIDAVLAVALLLVTAAVIALVVEALPTRLPLAPPAPLLRPLPKNQTPPKTHTFPRTTAPSSCPNSLCV